MFYLTFFHTFTGVIGSASWPGPNEKCEVTGSRPVLSTTAHGELV